MSADAETIIHMPVEVASKALKADAVVAALAAAPVAPPAPVKTAMAAAVADDEMF